MTDQFKTPIAQAETMMPKIYNLKKEQLDALWDKFGSNFVSEENFNKDRIAYAQEYAKLNKIPVEDAQILIDGALSNPGGQRGSLKGRSVGIYETEEETPNFDREAWTDELLAKNPEAWGVLYGYHAGGKFHKLKNPIYVNNQEDVNKYQQAIGYSGKSGPTASMAGRYR